MRSLQLRNDLARIGAAASLCALLAVLVFAAVSAGATDAEKLEAKLASARDEASSLSAQLQSTTAELASAEHRPDAGQEIGRAALDHIFSLWGAGRRTARSFPLAPPPQ